MTASTQEIYGADTPDPEPITLRMGAVSLLFEPHSGWVRRVRLNQGPEILRGIYLAVRDQNWNTLPATISNLELQQKRGGFQIGYRAECRQDEIHFAYEAEIVGTPDGKLTYSFRSEALTSFLKNRIGFCVLHPIEECAGKSVTIEHTDGERTRGRFPEWISPHQPFKDIRAITQDILWGVKATVRFTGEVFEMEDQRNWTDASYKTYSTPLADPSPIEITQGTIVEQSVTLEITGRVPDRAAETRNLPIVLHQASEKTMPLPDFGIGLAPLDTALTELEITRIAALNLSHLRVDIDFARENWRDSFLQTLSHLNNARLDEIPLEVALTLTQNPREELNALADVMHRLPRRTVARWLVFQHGEIFTPPEVWETAREILERYQHRAAFFAGTPAYFTELNRNRPNDGRHFCYTINPQVHAFDTRSLMETLPMQGDTVRNARRFGKNPFVSVSPITLKPRFNPNATSAEGLPLADPRQYALCGAAWTLGSIESLTQASAHSATYDEIFGAWGVMEREADGSKVSPLYHVLADVGEFANGKYALMSSSGRGNSTAELLLSKRERRRLLIANLTAETQEIEVEFPVRRITLKMLDETTLERAMTQPEAYRAEAGEKLRGTAATDWHGNETRRIRLTLFPYRIARLDGETIE